MHPVPPRVWTWSAIVPQIGLTQDRVVCFNASVGVRHKLFKPLPELKPKPCCHRLRYVNLCRAAILIRNAVLSAVAHQANSPVDRISFQGLLLLRLHFCLRGI
eukprot:2809817-Amphidinium_carterae.1